MIEGPGGIGKTSLTTEVRRRALDAGCNVRLARASELERDFAFGVVRQWLEAPVARASAVRRARLLDGAAGLAEPILVAPDPAATPPSSPGALHGLYWLIANLAAERPLVLVLDDAQATDEASLRAIGHLVARSEGLALAVVLACRPPAVDGADGPLVRLLADPAVRVMRPAALSAAAATQMLSARLQRRPDEEFSAACHRATGGNPFYLRELAEALAADAVAPTAGQVARIERVRPEAISRAVIARISPAARQLARALAILDAPAELTLAAQLAELEAAASSRAARELTSAGLIASAQRIEIAHPIVRSAVLGSLTSAERSAWHRRASDALRALKRGPDLIAVHLLATEPGAEAGVAEELRRAAAAAMARGAPESAVTLLRRALAEPPDERSRAQVLIEVGRAERAADLPGAADRFREAHRLAVDRDQRAAALQGLAWSIGPDAERQLELAPALDRAIDDARPGDPELALSLEETRLQGLMIMPEGREQFGARLDRLGQLPGATPAQCGLLAMRARHQMDRGRTAGEVGDTAEAAISNPDVLVAKGPDSIWALNCAVALGSAERFDALDRFLQRALALARDRGSASGFALISVHRAILARRRGNLLGSEAEARAALDSDALQGWYRLNVSGELMLTLIGQGRIADARAVHDDTGMPERIPDHRPLTPFLISRGVLRCAEEDLHGGLQDLQDALRRIARFSPSTIAGHDARVWAVVALRRLGRRGEAERDASAALEIARRWGAPGTLGTITREHALLLPGDPRVQQLRRAAALLADSPLKLEHAAALIELGAALRRGGHRAQSRGPLGEALLAAERSGAVPQVTRAREELAAGGIRVPRQRIGDGLTPSEQRVAVMAAGGASNNEIAQALFVTAKTVETHLAHAYRKLDIGSRRELAAALARRGLR